MAYIRRRRSSRRSYSRPSRSRSYRPRRTGGVSSRRRYGRSARGQTVRIVLQQAPATVAPVMTAAGMAMPMQAKARAQF